MLTKIDPPMDSGRRLWAGSSGRGTQTFTLRGDEGSNEDGPADLFPKSLRALKKKYRGCSAAFGSCDPLIGVGGVVAPVSSRHISAAIRWVGRERDGVTVLLDHGLLGPDEPDGHVEFHEGGSTKTEAKNSGTACGYTCVGGGCGGNPHPMLCLDGPDVVLPSELSQDVKI
ncbi:unnamed protein product [Sphenostylis stenocarpa]|uniref:Uncharacterized protein n=1 Tax=Sphenostylis stenocarpa TaxID=92480 RepID=A0AA86VM30_9FABA|nr:unnamed protein product [Sphenostylis stenocarpa]